MWDRLNRENINEREREGRGNVVMGEETSKRVKTEHCTETKGKRERGVMGRI